MDPWKQRLDELFAPEEEEPKKFEHPEWSYVKREPAPPPGPVPGVAPPQIQDIGRIANLTDLDPQQQYEPLKWWERAVYPFATMGSWLETDLSGYAEGAARILRGGAGLIGIEDTPRLDRAIEVYGSPEEHGFVTPFVQDFRERERAQTYADGTGHGILTDVRHTVEDLGGLLATMALFRKATPLPGSRMLQHPSQTTLPSLGKHLGRTAGHAFGTTTGGLEERAEATIMRIGYNVTPYLANATGAVGFGAVGTDFLLNAVLTSPVYMQAYDEAGGFNEDFASMVIPQLVMDLGMAWKTRGLPENIANAQYERMAKDLGFKNTAEYREHIKNLQDMTEKEFRAKGYGNEWDGIATPGLDGRGVGTMDQLSQMARFDYQEAHPVPHEMRGLLAPRPEKPVTRPERPAIKPEERAEERPAVEEPATRPDTGGTAPYQPGDIVRVHGPSATLGRDLEVVSVSPDGIRLKNQKGETTTTSLSNIVGKTSEVEALGRTETPPTHIARIGDTEFEISVLRDRGDTVEYVFPGKTEVQTIHKNYIYPVEQYSRQAPAFEVKQPWQMTRQEYIDTQPGPKDIKQEREERAFKGMRASIGEREQTLIDRGIMKPGERLRDFADRIAHEYLIKDLSQRNLFGKEFERLRHRLLEYKRLKKRDFLKGKETEETFEKDPTRIERTHRELIETALRRGHDVPEEVLREYPDLMREHRPETWNRLGEEKSKTSKVLDEAQAERDRDETLREEQDLRNQLRQDTEAHERFRPATVHDVANRDYLRIRADIKNDMTTKEEVSEIIRFAEQKGYISERVASEMRDILGIVGRQPAEERPTKTWQIPRKEFIEKKSNWSTFEEGDLFSPPKTQVEADKRYASRIVTEYDGKIRVGKSLDSTSEIVRTGLPDDMVIIKERNNVILGTKPDSGLGGTEIYGIITANPDKSIAHFAISSKYRGHKLGQILLEEAERAGFDIDRANKISPAYAATLHRYRTTQAIKEGKPVPEEVLKEYPDLRRETGVEEKSTEPPPPMRALQQREEIKPAAISETKDKAYADDIEVPVRYALVEMRDILTSHDRDLVGIKEFEPFRELQVRDRGERKASLEKQDDIIQRWQPERVAAPTVESGDGPPVLTRQGVALTGRLRLSTLDKLAEDYPTRYEQYTSAVKQYAEEKGLDPSKVDQMERPVFVRIADDFDSWDRMVDFTSKADKSIRDAHSDREQALASTRHVDGSLLRLLNPEHGIETAENRRFVNALMNRAFSSSEMAAFKDRHGALGPKATTKVKEILFAKAYREPEAVTMLTEIESLKNVQSSLLDFAHKAADLRVGAEEGRYPPGLDIGGNIGKAAVQLHFIKQHPKEFGVKKGSKETSVDLWVKQTTLLDRIDGQAPDKSPETIALMKLFDEHKRSAKFITSVLDEYYNIAKGASEAYRMEQLHEGKNLFGTPPPVIPDRDVAIDRAYQNALMLRQEEREGAARGQGALLEAKRPGETEALFRKRGSRIAEKRASEIRRESIVQPASKAEIRAYITEEFKLPVREGRLMTPGAMGEYKPWERVLRAVDTSNLPTVAHEFGHDLLYTIRPDIGRHATELREYALEKGLSERKYSPEQLVREGFSEYIATYMMEGREAAQKALPSLHRHFEERLSRNEDIKKKFDGLEDLYRRHFNQDPVDYIKGHTQTLEKKAEPLLDWREQLVRDWVDDRMLGEKLVKETTGKSGAHLELDMIKNPVALTTMIRVSDPAIREMLSYKVVDPFFREKKDVKPLEKIMDDVKPWLGTKQEIGDFETWIIAKSGIERQGYGKSIGIPQEVLKEAERALYRPEFEKAMKELQSYKDNLLDWAVEYHLLSREAAETMREYYEWHLPMYRVLGEESNYTAMASGNRIVNLPQVFKGAKGSEKPIINPLHSIVWDTHRIMRTALKNQAGVAFIDAIQGTKDMGHLVERLPTPKQMHEFSLRQIKSDLKEAGLSPEAIREMNLDHIAKTYAGVHYARLKEDRENIVTIRREGQVEFYQVHPDIQRYMKTMGAEPPGRAGKVAQAFIAMSNLFKAGAILSPRYWGLRNPYRDQFTSYVHGGDKGFVPIKAFIDGIMAQVKDKDSVHLWKAAMGARASLVSMERQYKDDYAIQKLLEPDQKRAISPLSFLQRFAESTENATRIGYFQKLLEGKDLEKMAPGEHREVVLRAASMSRGAINVDYAVYGTKARQANRYIPFTTATVGGMRKLYDEFARDPLGTIRRGFFSMGLPSILLYLLNRNDPRYEELDQWQKDLYWIIPTPNAQFKIMKPFLPGLLFGSGPERILQAIDEQDPSLLTEWGKNMFKYGAPNPTVPVLMPIFEALTNHSFWRGGEIIPRSEENLEPPEQYGQGTSVVGKTLGKMLNVSPRMMDHMVTGIGSSLSSDILSTIDFFAGEISGRELAGKITAADVYPWSGARSVTEFYDHLNRLEKQYATYNRQTARGTTPTVEHPNMFELRYYRGIRSDIADIRNRIQLIQWNPNMPQEQKDSMIEELNQRIVELARVSLDKGPLEPAGSVWQR